MLVNRKRVMHRALQNGRDTITHRRAFPLRSHIFAAGEKAVSNVSKSWENTYMSTDRMKIKPDDLSVAAVKAAGTANASIPQAVTPPSPAGTSPIDAAAALAIGAVTTLTTAVNAADMQAATTQTAALTESPPVLEQQDQKGADDMVVAGDQTKVIKFPTLKAGAPTPGGITSV